MARTVVTSASSAEPQAIRYILKVTFRRELIIAALTTSSGEPESVSGCTPASSARAGSGDPIGVPNRYKSFPTRMAQGRTVSTRWKGSRGPTATDRDPALSHATRYDVPTANGSNGSGQSAA